MDVLSSRILLRPGGLDRSRRFYRDLLGLAVYREFGPPDDPNEATQENEDGFRAYAEPVSDPAFDAASWETVKAAVPASSDSASVLFIADSISLSSPDHPILVVDLSDTYLSVAEFPEIAGRTPFRCIPSELWSIDNNLNIANMDWEEFAGSAGEDGVFRGFDQ